MNAASARSSTPSGARGWGWHASRLAGTCWRTTTGTELAHPVESVADSRHSSAGRRCGRTGDPLAGGGQGGELGGAGGGLGLQGSGGGGGVGELLGGHGGGDLGGLCGAHGGVVDERQPGEERPAGQRHPGRAGERANKEWRDHQSGSLTGQSASIVASCPPSLTAATMMRCVAAVAGPSRSVTI